MIATKQYLDRLVASRTQRNLTALVCLVVLITCGCGCSRPDKEVLASLLKEQWYLVCTAKRDEGKLGEWIVTFRFPGKEVEPIIREEISAPDGWKPIRFHCVSYNKAAKLLVCMALRSYPGEEVESCDVWVHDIKNSRSYWVGRKWRGISNFTWTPDGRKFAFMATKISSPVPRCRADVYIYDTVAQKLVSVADDGAVEDMASRTEPPVWSEDAKYLYYASIGTHVMRVDLDTLQKERLPIVAFAVLSVNGDEIVYAKDGGAKMTLGAMGTTELVIKAKLGDKYYLGHNVLYEAVGLWKVLVSPSRRFILLFDRRGYYRGDYVLIDLETGKTYKSAKSLLPSNISFSALDLFTCCNGPAKVNSDFRSEFRVPTENSRNRGTETKSMVAHR